MIKVGELFSCADGQDYQVVEYPALAGVYLIKIKPEPHFVKPSEAGRLEVTLGSDDALAMLRDGGFEYADNRERIDLYRVRIVHKRSPHKRFSTVTVWDGEVSQFNPRDAARSACWTHARDCEGGEITCEVASVREGKLARGERFIFDGKGVRLCQS